MNIGIDLGGSHIGIGAVDESGKIVKYEEVYNTEKDKENIEQHIESYITEVLTRWKNEEGVEFNKVGIGVPGFVVNNKVERCVNLGIKNYDLKQKIENVFPGVDVHIKNDAKCAALAEKKLGSLKDYSDCIFLCLGTGIGGAAFFDGELVDPKSGPGFEFGHTIIKEDGELCKCGNRGCFEMYCSMKALKRKLKDVLNVQSHIDGETLLKLVESNMDSEEIKNIIDEFVKNLCIGLSNIVNILEPQAICLGGGFVKYKELLLERIKEEFSKAEYIFYKNHIPNIVVASFENDAGVIGSALCI